MWSLYDAWDAIRRPLLLIVEEADRYAPQIADRETSPFFERMLDLAKQGRKLGITLILVTHRPADINECRKRDECGLHRRVQATARP